MPSATITSKGQTTIPKDIREALDLRPKDKAQFTLLPDGTLIMRAKLRSVLDLHGNLRKPGRKPISLDDIVFYYEFRINGIIYLVCYT